MSLRDLFICCCCPASTDDNDGIHINVKVNNACCQKTQTVYTDSTPKRNLFQRAASLVIRKRQAASEVKQTTKSDSSEIFKSATSLHASQTNSEKLST